MIGRLSGTYVGTTGGGSALVDVGGVGYSVRMTPESLLSLKEGGKVALLTHLAVREDALDLYGFLHQEDLSAFELLLTVSGIGPKSALAILGVAPAPTLRRAIAAGDTNYLTKVSGIGRKTAERIVLELKDKLGGKATSEGGELRDEAEALEALRALGYGLAEAREALRSVPENLPDTGARLREALRTLSRHKAT